MSQKIKDSTPKTLRSKMQAKSIATSTRTIAENETEKAATSAEMLRAMANQEELVDYEEEESSGETEKKPTEDNKLSLLAQSPCQAIADNTAFLIDLHSTEQTLTIAQLALAKYMEPVPVYQYLANVFPRPEVRSVKLMKMFVALRIENHAAYMQLRSHKFQSCDTSLIPPLGPSLRQWINEVNNLNLHNLFLCVLTPDPLSNPPFVHLYFQLAATDETDAKEMLRERVGEWNESQFLLSNVLSVALMKGLQAHKSDQYHIQLLLSIQEAWGPSNNKCTTYGSLKFWTLKSLMHRDADHTAATIRELINNHAMTSTPAGQPDYVNWVKRVKTWAAHLSEFDEAGYAADNLFKLFTRKYLHAIGTNAIAFDSLSKEIESGALTWDKLVKQVEKLDIQFSVLNRVSSICRLEASNHSTAMHISATEQSDANHTVQAAHVNTRVISKIDKALVKHDSATVQWSDSARCCIHKSGYRGKFHTNAECYNQKDIRDRMKTTKLRLTDVIKELIALKTAHQNSQSNAKDTKKPATSMSKKPIAKASLATAVKNDDDTVSVTSSISGNNSVSSVVGPRRARVNTSNSDLATTDVPTVESTISVHKRKVEPAAEGARKRKVEQEDAESKSPFMDPVLDGQPTTQIEGSPYGKLDIWADLGGKPGRDATDSEDERERYRVEAEKNARRERSNADRRARKRNRRALHAENCVRESLNSREFLSRGKTVAEHARHLVTKLREGTYGYDINRAIDSFRDALYAERDNRRNSKYLPSAREYLYDAGLYEHHLDRQSKSVMRTFHEEFKVRKLPLSHLSINQLTSTYYSVSDPGNNTSGEPITVASDSEVDSIADSFASDSQCNNKIYYINIAISQLLKANLIKNVSQKFDTIIDTGASTHILKDNCYANETYKFRKSTSRVALGDHNIQLTALGTCNVGILRKALLVPKMSLNLISGSCLERDGYSLTVKDSKCNIHDHRGDIIFSATLYDGLYCCKLADLVKVCLTRENKNVAAVTKVKKPSVISTKLDIELLHKRFGHASTEDIIAGLKNGTITGYTVDVKRENGKYQLQNGLCSVCMKAKAHKPPFYLSLSLKASAPGDYVVCDIQGPFGVETLLGDRYVVTYTDWYSRYSWTYLLKAKSEALEKLQHLVEVIFAAHRVVLRHYHSDQAGELHGSETVKYLERVVHATHSESEAYTPARNGIAERKFRTLAEMTAAMLFDSGLPKTFWGFAYLAATHVRNRIPTVTRDGSSTPRSPYELWLGQIPNIHYLRRWGCKCYVYIPKQHRTKTFPDKTMIGFLIGFTSTGSYDVYIPEREKVVSNTIQVTFDEVIPSHAESYFSELHVNDHIIDDTNPEKPVTVKDFEYLIGTTHIDDEDGLKYMTTRIVVNKMGHIVAYRSPVKINGDRNSWEDSTPIHVKDIARLTMSKCSGTERSNTPGVGLKTFNDWPESFQPHQIDLLMLKRKAVPSPSTSLHQDISLPMGPDGCDPDCETPKFSPYNLRNRKRVAFAHVDNTHSEYTTRSESNTESECNKKEKTPLTAGHSTSTNLNGSTRLKPTSTFRIFHTMVENDEFDIDLTPKTYKQAMNSANSHKWREAIDKELKSIADNNVFSLVPRPEGIRMQSGRFLFKIKYTGNNTVFKARLIAHGFRQSAGSDYWETYAPVTSCIATRIFLTLCATFNMVIHQMDIETAFLIADLTEELYMEPPIGMQVPDGMVLKLHKCLYGLKQSPRYFNQHLMNTLLKLGFQNLINEPCLFHMMVDGNLVIATIYVDDILIACHNIDIIMSIKSQMKVSYKMKDMGEMDWYLGMRCKRNKSNGSFTLDQSKYIDDVLAKFNVWIGAERTRTIPMQPNLVLAKWTPEHDEKLTQKEEKLLNSYPYRQIIGSLLYISIWTRPDISYTVGKLAKFNNHPTMAAIHATQWLLQYMRGTKHLGLSFIKGDMRLSTFVDSSFGDVVTDKRSTAGQITYLGKSPIQWDSFVCDNYSIPCSVAEAEYIAASEAARVLMANRNILIQLGFPQDQMFMFEDNKACIAIAIQEASTRKTKHVELQVHYIRDLIKSGRINMLHITTNIQLADIFTKPLTDEVFHRHLSVILGGEPTGDLQVYLRAKDDYNRLINTGEDESV